MDRRFLDAFVIQAVIQGNSSVNQEQTTGKKRKSSIHSG
jgi:hypothetical protein